MWVLAGYESERKGQPEHREFSEPRHGPDPAQTQTARFLDCLAQHFLGQAAAAVILVDEKGNLAGIPSDAENGVSNQPAINSHNKVRVSGQAIEPLFRLFVRRQPHGGAPW